MKAQSDRDREVVEAMVRACCYYDKEDIMHKAWCGYMEKALKVVHSHYREHVGEMFKVCPHCHGYAGVYTYDKGQWICQGGCKGTGIVPIEREEEEG